MTRPDRAAPSKRSAYEFVKLPAALFGAPSIGVYELGVYGALMRHRNSSTYACFPSIDRLADLLAVSRPKIISSIRLLEREGWVRKVELSRKGSVVKHGYVLYEKENLGRDLPTDQSTTLTGELPHEETSMTSASQPALPGRSTLFTGDQSTTLTLTRGRSNQMKLTRGKEHRSTPMEDTYRHLESVLGGEFALISGNQAFLKPKQKISLVNLIESGAHTKEEVIQAMRGFWKDLDQSDPKGVSIACNTLVSAIGDRIYATRRKKEESEAEAARVAALSARLQAEGEREMEEVRQRRAAEEAQIEDELSAD